MKTLIEKRNALLDEMDGILKKAETETRAFDETESTRFNEIKVEISGIDKTIKAKEESRSLEKFTPVAKDNNLTDEQVEERAFSDFVRGIATQETRTFDKDSNSAVIPNTIAKKIIKKIVEISPLYNLATKYNVNGNLTIPYYDETTSKITVSYADEFTDPTSTGGKLLSIELKGYLARAFTKISKTLVNESSFDIVGFVVNDMAQSFSEWIENELLNGTADKIDGLKGVTLNKTAASSVAITADELIDLQEEVIDAFQNSSIWIMSKATRKAIRKLKDNDGAYLLNKDATAKWGYSLFGKDVYVSSKMPDMAAGKVAIYYGDMSGLAIKIAENINVTVLQEKYAEQHAIGVLGFVSIDSKVENAQMIAKLTMKAAVV